MPPTLILSYIETKYRQLFQSNTAEYRNIVGKEQQALDHATKWILESIPVYLWALACNPLPLAVQMSRW